MTLAPERGRSPLAARLSVEVVCENPEPLHLPYFCGPGYVFSALRTRCVRSGSAGLAVSAAFGVRQLVGAFARGTDGSAASWLALAEDSGDESPHSKRWRDCETAASVPTTRLCDALNRYGPGRSAVRRWRCQEVLCSRKCVFIKVIHRGLGSGELISLST